MWPGFCSHSHQSLLRLSPSTWLAAEDVPHRNPFGNGRAANLGGSSGRRVDLRRRDVLPALRRLAVHLEPQHPRLADRFAMHLTLVLWPTVEQDPCRVERVGMAHHRDVFARMLTGRAPDGTQHPLPHDLDRLVAWEQAALGLMDHPQRATHGNLPEGDTLQVPAELCLAQVRVRLQCWRRAQPARDDTRRL